MKNVRVNEKYFHFNIIVFLVEEILTELGVPTVIADNL